MTTAQTFARTAADIRKAQRAWRSTVTLSDVRTDPTKFAQSHADLRAYAQVDTLDAKITDATTAVERISAELKDARGTVRTLSALKDAALRVAQDDAIWLVREVGVTQRAAGRIVGVSDTSVRNWLNPEKKAAANAKAGVKKADAKKDAKKDATPPTPREVKAALTAAAALIGGLEDSVSLTDLRGLESRVSAITAALADLQARTAKATRTDALGVAAPAV